MSDQKPLSQEALGLLFGLTTNPNVNWPGPTLDHAIELREYARAGMKTPPAAPAPPAAPPATPPAAPPAQ